MIYLTSVAAQLYRFSALVVLLTAVGCSSVKVAAPVASYVPPKTSVVEYSVFNVPVEVPMAEVQRQVNAQVPAMIYDDNSLDNNGGDNLIAQVKKRAPIFVNSTNGNLSFKIPLSIYVKAGWKTTTLGITLAKYEDTNFDIDLNFTTTIGIDPAWVVNTRTLSNGYTWVSKPVIKLGGFEIPITTVVEKIIDSQLPGLTKMIDEEVKKNLDLKPMLSKTWAQIQNPIQVDEKLNAWLKIRPQEVIMTPLMTKGSNLKMSIGLKAQTESTVGSTPTMETPIKLPALKTVASVNDKFQVSLMTLVGFNTLKQIATEQAVGKTFTEGKKSVTITGMDIYGQDNKLVIAVDLTGSVSGKIYLMGKPNFDAATNQLYMDELDYNLETKNALLKTADWLAHGKFVNMMAPYFKVSVKQQIDDARKAIDQNLNKTVTKGVTLKGKLDQLKPGQLLVTEQGIQALITATGALNVLIDGL